MVKLNRIWIGVIILLIFLTLRTAPRTGTSQPLCDMAGCVSAQDMERLDCYNQYSFDALRIQTDPFYRADVAHRMTIQCGLLQGIADTAACLNQQLHGSNPFSDCALKMSPFITQSVVNRGLGPLD